MKRMLCLFAIGLVVGIADVSSAGTLPGTMDEGFLRSCCFSQLTLGANFEDIQRRVEFDRGFETDWEALSYSLFVGVSVESWFTVFGTLGGAENEGDLPRLGDPLGNGGAPPPGGGPAPENPPRDGRPDDNDDPQTKWSLGANVNLCKWDLRGPRALVGDRVAVRGFLEYSSYEIEQGRSTADWTELMLALPIAYERFERNAKVSTDEKFRLAVFAGPAVSTVDGTLDDGERSMDFAETESFGGIGGLTLYFTRHVALGGQVQLFGADADDLSARASMRYRF